MDCDGDMVGVVQRRRRSVERRLVKLPSRRGQLPDQARELAPVLVIALSTTLGGEVELVPPLQLRLRSRWRPDLENR
jgi:hypothetical protein